MKRSLRDMVEEGESVRLFCLDCGRDRTVALSAIVSDRDMDSEATLRDIKQRLRCSRCEGRRVEVMAPSHRIAPLQSDRERRIETNVKHVPCPECRSQEVSRSGPLLRQGIKPSTAIPGQFYDYECEDCGNWWTAG